MSDQEEPVAPSYSPDFAQARACSRTLPRRIRPPRVQALPALAVALTQLSADARRWSSAADAEDLLQATAERALQNFHRFRPGTHLLAWLRTMMYRIAVDQSRRRRTDPIPWEDSLLARVKADEVDEPCQEWPPADTADVDRTWPNLPEPLRATFQLWWEDRLSYGAIGARLGVPVNTVGSRLLRARRRIKCVLIDRDGHAGT